MLLDLRFDLYGQPRILILAGDGAGGIVQRGLAADDALDFAGQVDVRLARQAELFGVLIERFAVRAHAGGDGVEEVVAAVFQAFDDRLIGVTDGGEVEVNPAFRRVGLIVDLEVAFVSDLI